jgi:hypothetical protein
MKDDDFNLKEPHLPEYFRKDIDVPLDQIFYYEKGPKKYGRVMSMIGVRHEHYKIISNHPNLETSLLIKNPSHPLRSIYREKSKPVFEWFGIDSKEESSAVKGAVGATLYAIGVGYKASLVEKILFGPVRMTENKVIASKTSCNTFLIQLTKVVQEETAMHFTKLIDHPPGNKIMTPAIGWELQRKNRRKRIEVFLINMEKTGGTVEPMASDMLQDQKTERSRKQEFTVLRYLIDSGFYFGRIMAVENIQKNLLYTA